MCGFAGVVAWDEKYRVSPETLEKMSRAIAHRGPDGQGYHLTRQNEPITPDTPQVGLAFRRLAILDPDPRSNQPFHIGPLTLVFNGEIYNFRELKSEISSLRPDYRWRTTGDTEVLLMAYQVWGQQCLPKLNGMFAFAIWDEQKKELFVARDRMGQKPLFIIHHPGQMVALASELQALRGYDPPATDDVLIEYLRYGCIGGCRSVQRHCVKQAAGSWSVFRQGLCLSGGRYYDPNAAGPSCDDPSAQTRLRVQRAVERQLVSDVPLGVFLSGGIDSSVIAACARQFGAVQTFSIGFDDPRYDEMRYAAAVARHLGTTHRQFIVQPTAAEDLPKLAQMFGEPFGDSSALPTHYLARETRKHVKVALSGDGGDELFGGYDRYRAMHLASRLARSPWAARQLLAALGRPWAGGHPKSTFTRAARLLGSLPLDDARRYAGYLRIFDDATIAELLQCHNVDPHDHVAELFQRQLGTGATPVQAALAVDRITYLPDDLLTKVDRCSMLHGLEVRSPFMDHELVQLAAGLKPDQLFKGGPKRMLREAFAKDLPDFVFKRTKMGFAVPIGAWFRGELRSMLREELFASDSFSRNHFNMKLVQRLVDEHERRHVDHSQRLYALLMLELWWRWYRST
ncbi:MAG TPA: asparagine synthase (glutamine-hydrolyzing) [Tepidisphaeraceae bacterium]|nr:asparagine synthase (glutamine-hydrolyzing) [Tepidisphaeraceae bacterium]